MSQIDKVKALESRYQTLLEECQANKLDKAEFVAEVYKLMFQDSWGRCWMIEAQSGNWHYFDGYDWRQADPAEADKLPFLDDQGRYWQKGVRSGDWYYYQPETEEWVRASPEDEPSPFYEE